MSAFLSQDPAPSQEQLRHDFMSRSPPLTALPQHIAFIMDGNARWAKKRGLAARHGHRAGGLSLKNIVKLCAVLGIPFISVYAFSTENWRRERREIKALIELGIDFFRKELNEVLKLGVRLVWCGDISPFPQSFQDALAFAVSQSAHSQLITLNMAINYSGRQELVAAAKKLSGSPADVITEAALQGALFNGKIPDPDLLIRTGGDMRLSNFMLWQLAYTELYFTKLYWPDFNEDALRSALSEYQIRERRFGGR